MSFKNIFYSSFSSYVARIEKKIAESISTLGEKTQLRDACEYALLNGGKRIRPAIVLIIGEGLGQKDLTLSALAVEYFHTASLIADDLPCMDNDDQRRDLPSLHKAYNETIALLASYALIASGYEKIGLSSTDGTVLSLAIQTASKTTGIQGATGGQYLDLFPHDLKEEELFETIEKKTATLFELSFVLGWLIGGGDIDKLDLVKKGAKHFGTAFQILDDIQDREEDQKRSRKINASQILGEERAKRLLKQEVDQFCTIMEELKLPVPILTNLALSFTQETVTSSSFSSI